MEFLASLAIKALIGTSICGGVTVGTIYTCDRTLLGFAPLTKDTGTSRQVGGNQERESSAETKEEGKEGEASMMTISGDTISGEGGVNELTPPPKVEEDAVQDDAKSEVPASDRAEAETKEESRVDGTQKNLNTEKTTLTLVNLPSNTVPASKENLQTDIQQDSDGVQLTSTIQPNPLTGSGTQT